MRFKAMDPIWEKTWPDNWLGNYVIDGRDPLFQNLYDNATRFRDKPALIFYGGIITWWQLRDMVMRAANGLKGLGVTKGDRDLSNLENNVPLGEQGELWLRGPSVAAGYWNKPEETAETFIEGWIRTGDIATMDEDGYVTLNGRLRELIKASGYSVFPAEVETYLYQHPAILECCVIGVPHDYRGEDVKAFVVLKPDWVGKITEEELIAWSREQMSVYKYPREIEFRDELPKSGTGKILRRILKEE